VGAFHHKRLTCTTQPYIRDCATNLETEETLEQLGQFPGWRLHPLIGGPKGS
jgi:hypothetical protein